MYKLEYLPVARRDLVDIARYVSGVLGSPGAAERLALELVEAAEGILRFPYANPVYLPIQPLKREYRKCMAGNYLILYWAEEEKKLITVARVVYARRNYDLLLGVTDKGWTIPKKQV